MVRTARNAMGGHIYHVINRATNRRQIFNSPEDYQEFFTLLSVARNRFAVELYAFAIMPNHVHLLLRPKGDDDMQRYMHWLFTAHGNIYRTKTDTIGEGHVYQGRYKSFLVESDDYYFNVLKYIEQNPLRANLVERAEDWKWGSVWIRTKGTVEEKKLLDSPFLPLPNNYHEWINERCDDGTLMQLRESVNKGLPFGSETWKSEIAEKYGIVAPRSRGRPRK